MRLERLLNMALRGCASASLIPHLNHEYTSRQERARVDAFFGRYLAAVRKSDDYWIEHEPGGRLNNHYAWHKLGRSKR